MIESEIPKLTIDFLGCSKDSVAIQYTAFKTRRTADAVNSIWDDIENGSISNDCMRRYLMEQRETINDNSPSQAQFLFVTNNVSCECLDELNFFSGKPSSSIHKRTISSDSIDQIRCVMPPDFEKNLEIQNRWLALQAQTKEFYHYCLQQGINEDVASIILPSGRATRELLTIGYQPMQRLLDQYMCSNVYWELQEVSWQIFKLMGKKFPTLARRLGIKCWENRRLCCDETIEDYNNCKWGKSRPHQNDLLSIWEKKVVGKNS